MKRICKNCFSSIDRKLDICPVCKKPVKPQKKGPSVGADSLGAKNKETVVLKNPDEINVSKNIIKEDLDSRHFQKNGKLKWIPKNKRKGYKSYFELHKKKERRVDGRHIDVSDACYFYGKYASKNKYNAKNPLKVASGSSGEGDSYELEKLEWWEIYKRCDRFLARRKINKIMKSEARKIPEDTSYFKMLMLTIFTGFLGLHNIYVKNFKRGFTMLGLFAWCILFASLLPVLTFLNYVWSLCAIPGLILIVMWINDILWVLTKKYIYKTKKLEFMYGLDIETRAWFGKKYLDVPSEYINASNK